jgi:hypothetical protein
LATLARQGRTAESWEPRVPMRGCRRYLNLTGWGERWLRRYEAQARLRKPVSIARRLTA